VKILVPLDGSRNSEAILPVVAAIAGPLRAEVELLGVVTMDQVHQTPGRMPNLTITPTATATGALLENRLRLDTTPRAAESREQAIIRLEAAELDYLQAQVTALPGITPEIAIVFADDPAAVIIDRAREGGASLIAMATHGHGSLRQLLTGSVTERVIRAGVAPVLTLRPDHLLHGADGV
jgi:nucleotide-binding universal stress UspA family protein